MATGELSKPEQAEPHESGSPAGKSPRARPLKPLPNPFWEMLNVLASLRLTVGLFVAAILLVLFGTLAQVHYDVWRVVRETHFHVWVAVIEWRSVGRFIELVFGGEWDGLEGWFLFPGGKTIGTLMVLNLLAAHAVRFKATAKGGKLIAGVLVLAIASAATAWIVLTGSTEKVAAELSPQFAMGLWHALRLSVAGLSLGGVYWLASSYRKVRFPEWLMAAALVASIVVVAAWLLLNPEVTLDDSSLRILWVLVKGSAAAAALLVGCLIVFGKRAGVALLHAGVGLLMFGEIFYAIGAEESNMTIVEGQTVNYSVDIRTTELAFTDRSDPENERVTVVPERFIKHAGDDPIKHPELPFDLRVLRFDENSVLKTAAEDSTGQENPATIGPGLLRVAQPVAPVSGIRDQGVDRPSAYVELLEKSSGESLGVFLVSTAGDANRRMLPVQTVEGASKNYALELRFKRIYKDYAVKLREFSARNYAGTSVAKDYRADITLLAPGRGENRDYSIWMNNPLRFAGDTLYQASFEGDNVTTLQVVSNSSWMIPYVSCMVVAFGMVTHFGVSLMRFLRRRSEEAARAAKRAAGDSSGRPRFDWTSPVVVGPVVVGILWGCYLASKARPVKDSPGEMSVHAFGKLPIVEGGRVKPYDTLARNTLQLLSARQEVVLGKEPLPKDASLGAQIAYKMKRGEKLPAISWLLDVVSRREGADGKPVAEAYHVFRIENLDVLRLIDLAPRPGSFRYSYDEINKGDNAERIREQIGLVRKVDEEKRSVYQNKIVELDTKLQVYRTLINSFGSPLAGLRPDSIEEDLVEATLAALTRAPKSVAPAEAGGEWLTLYEAQLANIFRQFPGARSGVIQRLQNVLSKMPREVASEYSSGLIKLFDRLQSVGSTPTAPQLMDALNAYAEGDRAVFGSSVRDISETLNDYETRLDDPANAEAVAPLAAAERLSLDKTSFETFFNGFSPFFYCWVSYLVAFVLTMISWLAWPKALGRSATAIIIATLLVHTFAIIGRIYISGRPPVTNLYSSAVFIGWAVVVAGLAQESIYRMGIGNAIASVYGFATLVIAHLLGTDGDTLTVLVAVLDTQFWLATHVVCITLGYAATFVAGGLAILYLIRAHMFNSLPDELEKSLPRMVYGALCFAILFSFIGTVLGGLWGDNSWGRFWGWDPKENGALIIVLWNALVLHARWGKMVGPSGLAALAVIGNICTTWSWFGVNELGVGLHAYGGLSDGVSLELFIVRAVAWSHPLLLLVAFIPRSTWRQLFHGPPQMPTVS